MVQGASSQSYTSEYYSQLLALLNTAISSGDLSGGSAFDKTTLLNLEAQAQSFTSLPTATAGNRVMDDTFNYPLSLLQARLGALAAEAGNFTAVSGRLLEILAKETRSLPRRAHIFFRARGRAGTNPSLSTPAESRFPVTAGRPGRTYVHRALLQGFRTGRVHG